MIKYIALNPMKVNRQSSFVLLRQKKNYFPSPKCQLNKSLNQRVITVSRFGGCVNYRPSRIVLVQTFHYSKTVQREALESLENLKQDMLPFRLLEIWPKLLLWTYLSMANRSCSSSILPIVLQQIGIWQGYISVPVLSLEFTPLGYFGNLRCNKTGRPSQSYRAITETICLTLHNNIICNFYVVFTMHNHTITVHTIARNGCEIPLSWKAYISFHMLFCYLYLHSHCKRVPYI